MFLAVGPAEFRGDAERRPIAITTRSGNLDQPQKNWSAWSGAITDPKGGRVTSPAARFVQWKATLPAGAAGSPELEAVDVAYLPKNVAPRIEQIEITPPNYRFPRRRSRSRHRRATITLPPIGKRHARRALVSIDSSAPSMQFGQGLPRRALDGGGRQRRQADLHGGDPRAEGEAVEAAQGQGEGEVPELGLDRVSRRRIPAARDGIATCPAIRRSEALTTQLESDPFLIDNTPPAISGLTAARSGKRPGGALEGRRRAERDQEGGVLAGRRRVDGGGAGEQAVGFAGAGLQPG